LVSQRLEMTFDKLMISKTRKFSGLIEKIVFFFPEFRFWNFMDFCNFLSLWRFLENFSRLKKNQRFWDLSDWMIFQRHIIFGFKLWWAIFGDHFEPDRNYVEQNLGDISWANFWFLWTFFLGGFERENQYWSFHKIGDIEFGDFSLSVFDCFYLEKQRIILEILA